MHRKTLMQLSQALSNKEVSSVELTRHFLDRIKRHDPQLNSFITVDEEYALRQALAADQSIAEGTATPFTGIPIAQKDIFCTKEMKTTCASKMLSQFVPPYNATLIEKCHHAGMVLLGKTNMDEFAMGSSNENSYYGAVKNPWNQSYTPGGSSGGSAAAVAARLTPVATGTDTGGSIRQPAALCGVTGLKPTYGRLSRFGMIAFASSLDQAGPLTQTAEDAALIMNLLAGHDPKDSTSINSPVPDHLSQLELSLQGVRIGLPKEYFANEINASVQSAVDKAIQLFQSLGGEIVEISLPHTEFAIPAYYVIAPAEASSNLARFDGVRYGYRCKDPLNLEDLYKRSRGEGFGSEVKRRILIGTHVLSSGYYEAYYRKAQKIRRQICDDFKHAFEKVDVILTPSTPAPAFKLGEKSKNPIEMYMSDIFTIAVNLSGLPALSLPAGFNEALLPIGVQLIGNRFQEAQLLQLGHQFQKVTEWHRQIPHQFES